tara:strand:- start:61524 stop:61790 length:267 start_codon:yes stop_codon:yes gene_type:complete
MDLIENAKKNVNNSKDYYIIETKETTKEEFDITTKRQVSNLFNAKYKASASYSPNSCASCTFLEMGTNICANFKVSVSPFYICDEFFG